MSSTPIARRALAAVAIVGILLGASAPALAAGNSRDQSNAMRYGASAPLGQVIESLVNEDDATETFPAPWPINFFGTKYEGLCVTTNGGVYPVLDALTECSNEYDLDLENLALSSQAPMIAVLAADADLSACDAARVEQRDGAGDGFGRPCTIYLDTAATIDGRDAVVVTWYRVSQYENSNLETLENTYQLALIKLPTTDGDTVGYNFDLEFNYGTVMDPEDGYSAALPSEECVSLTDDCRWGIGIASYTPGDVSAPAVTEAPAESVDPAADPSSDAAVDPAAGDEPVIEPSDEPTVEPAAVESAVGYEFFKPTKVANMMDNGATPLIANSLGTTVLGRYTCGMVNGAAVGCDPVNMQGPALAETGLSESAQSLAAVAFGIGLVAVALGAGMVRRSSRRTLASR